MLMAKKIFTLAFMLLTLATASTNAYASTSMELIEIDQQVQINLVNGSLHVIGANGLTLEIYNVAGVRIMNTRIDSHDKVIDLSLAKGCYIVKVGKTARKISVK